MARSPLPDGPPAPKRHLPVARPWLGEEEAAAARRAILSGWVTQGPEVAAFEAEFAEFVGAPHACAVTNCTSALFLALRALGVGTGHEVITVSHSFIATANSIRHCGAVPVFVDIVPNTYNIDPAGIEAAITPRTRALLVVHQLGMPCDLDTVLALAARRGLPVVEDAACAVGAEIRGAADWERIGHPHGEVACFSFHPRKLLTTGDGGMLTTRRPDLDSAFRASRQHCMSVDDRKRHESSQVVLDSYSDLGYNFRMTDIQAAVGRVQLRRLPEMVARRREQASLYASLLERVWAPGVPREPEGVRSNWQSYCFRLPPGTDRMGVMQRLLDRGISTRRGVMCTHREPAYPSDTWRGGDLARSERASDETLLLPLFHDMTARDQEAVAEALREALA